MVLFNYSLTKKIGFSFACVIVIVDWPIFRFPIFIINPILINTCGESRMFNMQIEDIAAATTKDFNKFFFNEDEHQDRNVPRGTPIDQLAKQYLGLDVSFTHLSSDGSLCGVTAYSDTEYIVETDGMTKTISLKRNQILLDSSFIEPGQIKKLCGKRRFTLRDAY